MQVGPRSSTSGPDGAFALALDQGRFDVTVEAAGFCRDVISLEGGLAAAPARIELRPAGTLELTVVDGSGAAVPGAGVELRGSPVRTPLLRHCDPLQREDEAEPEVAWMWSTNQRTPESWTAGGTTNPQGRIALDGLPPGEYEARVAGQEGDAGWVAISVPEARRTTLTLRR